MSALSADQAKKLREYNRKKSTEFLDNIGQNLAKKYLKERLLFWGTILGLCGFISAGLNIYLLCQSTFSILSLILLVWSLGLLVVAVLDWIICNNKMLMITGIVILIHGLLTTLTGGLIWGPIMFVASFFVIRDSRKALRKQKESFKTTPPPLPLAPASHSKGED